MAKVLIENLNKNYGEIKAVQDLTIDIDEEEFMVLLGPSGCGKTTTLRCVAGLEKQDSGNIYIDNKLVNDIPPKDRDVAMVFQSYALFPNMSVFNNIAFPLKMRKVPKNEISNRVEKVADLLQIETLLTRNPGELSGGQKQRVALGRAIVREPKVFLMDEPLSNLDAKLRIHMRAELKSLQKKLGITTIYVTHDQTEAMTMATRIAVLEEGFLQQVDTPNEVYFNPENIFVGSFVGNPPMNFLECRNTEKEGKIYIESAEVLIQTNIPEKNMEQAAQATKLFLGFRPEDIRLNRKKTIDESIKAKVIVIEPLGCNLLLTLMVGDKIVKALAPPYFEISVEEEIWLTLNKNNIHIYDEKCLIM